MGIVRFLKKMFPKKGNNEKAKADMIDGHCPMCWGFNEYDHKVRKAVEDKYMDVKNHKTDYIKSQGFAKNHIDGKRKRKLKVEVCPKCGKEKKQIDIGA